MAVAAMTYVPVVAYVCDAVNDPVPVAGGVLSPQSIEVVKDCPGKSVHVAVAVIDNGLEPEETDPPTVRLQVRFMVIVAVALFAAGLTPLLTCTQ